MCGPVLYIGTSIPLISFRDIAKKAAVRGTDGARIIAHKHGNKVYEKVITLGDSNNLDFNDLFRDDFGEVISESLDADLINYMVRWATTSPISEENTPPFTSPNGRFIYSGNGDHHKSEDLAKILKNEGYELHGENDFRVIAPSVQYLHERKNIDVKEAFRRTLAKAGGYFTSALTDVQEDKVYLIKTGQQSLVIGLGEKGYYIASEPQIIQDEVRDVIVAPSNKFVDVTRNGISVPSAFAVNVINVRHGIRSDKGDFKEGSMKTFGGGQ